MKKPHWTTNLSIREWKVNACIPQSNGNISHLFKKNLFFFHDLFSFSTFSNHRALSVWLFWDAGLVSTQHLNNISVALLYCEWTTTHLISDQQQAIAQNLDKMGFSLFRTKSSTKTYITSGITWAHSAHLLCMKLVLSFQHKIWEKTLFRIVQKMAGDARWCYWFLSFC